MTATLQIFPALVQGSVQAKDAARFYRYVAIAGANDCWEWCSTIKKTGYGHFWVEGRTVGAHRVSYEISNGAIPKGQLARHVCDNKSCVNPRHLLTGTVKDNARDAIERGRYRRGARNGRAKLAATQVSEIRKRQAAGETQVSLARFYGVSRSAIQWIINGTNWARIGEQP